jgi:cytochrome c oxidase subunit 4
MGADTQVYHSHKKKYFMVFLLLGALTVLELFVADGMELAYKWKAIWLTVLALGKAWAVAYWYMHLEEDTAWLKFIAAIPMSAFAYAVVVILESVSR